MPCSFGPLQSPRSGAGAQCNGLLKVTVTVRCIPLVTAAYGTRVARPVRTTRLAPGGDGSELDPGVARVANARRTAHNWGRTVAADHPWRRAAAVEVAERSMAAAG
jgi:hypothetical protein